MIYFKMEYYIYLKMPSYLRQWVVNRHGGETPVHLIRGSVESKLLQRVTVKMPDGMIPPKRQPDELAIVIPSQKIHDPKTYNHITETGKSCMVKMFKNAFDIDLWNFLSDFGAIGRKQKDLIYLFMEQNGIAEDGQCWDAIAKSYQRMRNIYLTKMRRKERKKNN